MGKCPAPPRLGARSVPAPYAMPCVPSEHTRAICSHTDPYAQPRGSTLIPNVTPRPPTPHSPALPRASLLIYSTLLMLSSSLRVKGSTRRCYGWRTKAYKLTPPLLNYQGGTKYVHAAHMDHNRATSKLGRMSPPSKNTTSSSVQLTHNGKMSRNVHPWCTPARPVPAPYVMPCVPTGHTCALHHMHVHLLAFLKSTPGLR